VSAEREHPRYAHEVAVTFHVGAKTYEGRTQNVSRGGLCANLGELIALGTDCEVDIVLVFDDEMQSEALRLPARVVWCTTVDDAHQVGVSFKPLPAERVQYLTMFLKYLGEDKVPKAAKSDNIDDRFG
jgi:hypothetical protein